MTIAIIGWVLAALGWAGFLFTQRMLQVSIDNFDALVDLMNRRETEDKQPPTEGT